MFFLCFCIRWLYRWIGPGLLFSITVSNLIFVQTVTSSTKHSSMSNRPATSRTREATAAPVAAAEGANPKWTPQVKCTKKLGSSSKTSKGKAPVRAREDSGYSLSFSLGLHTLMPPTATNTESTNDRTSPENQPPEPEHNTATATNVIHQVYETSKDIEESHKAMMKHVCINPAEKAKQEVIFSYNIINLTDLPLAFKNPYNLLRSWP